MTRNVDGRRATGRRLIRLVAAVAVTLALLPAGAMSAAADDGPTWALPGNGDLLSGFERSDYNERDGVPQQVASPDDPSRRALQFTLQGGDQRTELEPRMPDQREGQVQYYTYLARLAPDFPTDVNTWQLILQWHHEGDSGSPPIAVEVRGNRLVLAAEGEDLQDLGPVRGGDLIDLTLRVVFSQDPDNGAVDVWRDGDHVLQAYRPQGGTMLDDGNYLKVGLYRDRSIEETGRLWLDDLRVGPTMASVSSPERSGTEPVEDGTVASGGSSSSSSTESMLTWLAGGLLVVLVGAAAIAALRTASRR